MTSIYSSPASLLSSRTEAAPVESRGFKLAPILKGLPIIVFLIRKAQPAQGLSPATVSQEWLKMIKHSVKKSCASLRFHELGDLCNALFLEQHSEEELIKMIDTHPLKDSLCSLLCKIMGVSSEEFDAKKAEIVTKPKMFRDVLFTISDEELSKDGYTVDERTMVGSMKLWAKSTLRSIETEFERNRNISEETVIIALLHAASSSIMGCASFLLSLSGVKKELYFLRAFHYAADKGRLDILKNLLSIDGVLTDDLLKRIIKSTIAKSQYDILRFILKTVKSIDEAFLESITKVEVRDGNIEAIKVILSEGRSLSPLSLLNNVLDALSTNQFQIVEFYLTHFEFIDSIDKHTLEKIFLIAGYNKKIDIINLVLSKRDDLRGLDLLKANVGAILDDLHDIKDPTIKYSLLVNFAAALAFNPLCLEEIVRNQSPICGGNSNANKHYIQLMVCFLTLNNDASRIEPFTQMLLAHKFTLESSQNFRPLLNLFALLDSLSFQKTLMMGQLSSFPLPKIYDVACSIFFDKSLFVNKKDRNKNLQSIIVYMTALLSLESFEWVDEFLSVPENERQEFLFRTVLDSLTGLGAIHFTAEQFKLAIKNMRNPGAILFYISTVEEVEEISDVYLELLNHVILDTFDKWRAEVLTSRHIAKMKAEHSEIWDRWLSPGVDDAYIDDVSSGPTAVDAFSYILGKFGDDHHTLGGAVHPYLEGFKELLSRTKEELTDVLKELESMRASGAPDNSRSITHRALLHVILSADPSSIQSHIDIALAKLKEGGDCPLIHDLESFKGSLRSFVPKATDSFVTHTQNFEDLFLSGTEVIGSCQSVKAGASTNHCLLAYVIDAKNSMIAVKSRSSGRIESRAIIKLLFEGDNPVLFLDRAYSMYPSVPDRHKAVIREHAARVADNLKVPLYLYDEGGAVSLESLDSTTPFEYEDATAGGMYSGITNGRFTVSKASSYKRP